MLKDSIDLYLLNILILQMNFTGDGPGCGMERIGEPPSSS